MSPIGDIGYRFAMAAASPIPPDDEDERLGVAEEHDLNYERYLVASGPYMSQGSETMDFSADREGPGRGAGLRPRPLSRAGP